MSQHLESLRRLRAHYAELRASVAQQREACAAGDAEAVLAAALEGDWAIARLGELHAEHAALGGIEDPLARIERAACAAEAEALAKDLAALAADVGNARDQSAQELAALPTTVGMGNNQAPPPMLLDTRG